MKIELKSTKNYDMFDIHELNRPLHEDEHLHESMKKHGFMPSSPIQCVRNGGDKLKVMRGHHRLHYAKRLGLPVWYVIDESNTDIFALEGSSLPLWNVRDFAEARAKSGDQNYVKLLRFRKAHGLTIGSAASLVGGQSAGSGNKQKDVKRGLFEAGDMKHAENVVLITDHCKNCGVPFATTAAFVAAVSAVLRVTEFDANRFMHRVSLYAGNLHRSGSREGCLAEIDALYNYGAKSKRIPLAFLARKIGKTRQQSFGKKN